MHRQANGCVFGPNEAANESIKILFDILNYRYYNKFNYESKIAT